MGGEIRPRPVSMSKPHFFEMSRVTTELSTVFSQSLLFDSGRQLFSMQSLPDLTQLSSGPKDELIRVF